MITLIGLIVGLYTSFRFIDCLFDKNRGWPVRILALLVLAVTILCLVSLVTMGTTPSPFGKMY